MLFDSFLCLAVSMMCAIRSYPAGFGAAVALSSQATAAPVAGLLLIDLEDDCEDVDAFNAAVASSADLWLDAGPSMLA